MKRLLKIFPSNTINIIPILGIIRIWAQNVSSSQMEFIKENLGEIVIITDDEGDTNIKIELKLKDFLESSNL